MAKDKSAEQSEQMEKLIAQIAERVQARLEDEKEPVTSSDETGAVDTSKIWQLFGATPDLQASLADDVRLKSDCRFVNEASDEAWGLVVAALPPTDMCRIADGIGGSPLSDRVIDTLLAGKPVIVLKEGVAFMAYQATAPINFYRHFEEEYNRLMCSGVTVCAKKDLSSVLCARDQQPVIEREVTQSSRGQRVWPSPPNETEQAPSGVTALAEGEIAIERHIITERDINDLVEKRNIRVIIVNQDAIVTDMAEELLEDHHIAIVKRG